MNCWGHVRVAVAVRVQDLDGIEPRLLGNAVPVAANGAGNVGAMAVAVRVDVVGEVGSPGGTAAKVLLGDDGSVPPVRSQVPT